MRKHISGYLKNLPNITKYRSDLMRDLTLTQVQEKLDEIYEYYSMVFSTDAISDLGVIPTKAEIKED
jgi:hypothetical protein